MFRIQTDVLKPGSTEEYVRHAFSLNNQTLLNAFTVCVRTKIIQYREIVPFYSYSYSDRADNGLLMCELRDEIY